MRDHRRRSPARLLAPIALIAFTVAFFAILLSAGSGGGGGATSTAPREAARTAPKAKTTTGAASPSRRVYTVKTGDTLARIAEKTGVPVERLQELNPQLDPQALVSGQKIKLRE